MLTFPSSLRVRDLRAPGLLRERLDAPPYRRRELAAVTGVAIHACAWPTTPESMALYQTTKVEGDPYPAIAYHFVISAEGEAAWCQDLEVETWHAGAVSSTTRVAICLDAAASDAGATEQQIAATCSLLGCLERFLGRPLDVQPHHLLLPVTTTCPGPTWERWGPRLVAEDAACTT